MSDEPRDDDDRRAILARRSRLIAIALSGLTGAITPGCYESHEPGALRDAGMDAAQDGGLPVPCLGAPLDAGPTPCLEAPIDAGPAPCLDVPFDGGTDDP